MASLICCRVPEETNRKRNVRLIIGCPQDFRHISHYGDNDNQSNNLPLSMSSKCGDGILSQNFHLECIDLKERNGVVLGDISNNENISESPKYPSTPSKYNMGPPKIKPPPPPIITQH